MPAYRRVTYEDRCQIFYYLARGISKSNISKKLGFHKSTISREIHRDTGLKNYSFESAHQHSLRSKKRCRRKYLIKGKSTDIIKAWLRFGLSPEQISGRLKVESLLKVSTPTIYNYLNRLDDLSLKTHLRRYGRRGGGRHAQRKGKRSQFRSIWDRSKAVKSRFRRGDWERDGMYIADRKQLLVLNERKSRYVKIVHMGTGRPKEVTEMTNKIITKMPFKSYTMTNDNGPEFRDSQNVNIKTYHCDIGKPQQRGTIENTIGLLREYISRKSNARELTNKEIKRIEDFINFRPRKCLDYKTPFEVLFKTKVALAF